MKYLLDTNILIEAKNGFYAFDLCPGFWNWLKSFGDMRSINRVKEELLQGNDDLADWVTNELPEDYFIAEDTAIQKRYREVGSYVNSLAVFDQAKKEAFFSGADGWLIAAALERNVIIVTHERLDLGNRKKILLPNIAQCFHINCLKITDVLRQEHVSFN